MAGASGSAKPAEMGTVEIPTVPGVPDATVAEQNEHHDRDDHGSSPASENKENEERDRSRSPRGLNVPEPNPDNPLEVLSACASLAVGVTSMVAALKTSSEKLEVLIGNTQSLQNDLVRSMDTLAKAIQGMSQTVESLAGGVSYNTSRVGALCGEFQKVRKHLEWSMNRTFGDMMKEAAAKGPKIPAGQQLSLNSCLKPWTDFRRISRKWLAEWKPGEYRLQCKRRDLNMAHRCHQRDM